ncbi:MAG: DUF2231 domain-containing protein [Fidelibacterota bacterium]
MDIPIHPILVHFPIALITSAFFFQALYVWKLPLICRTMSMWLLGLGALLSIPATVSGQEEAVYVGQFGLETIVLETIQLHELMANLATWGSLITVLAWVYFFLNNPHDDRIDRLALAFLGLLTGFVIFTGYLGGLLSHGHGVGMP